MKLKLLILVLALQTAWILGTVILKESGLRSGQLIFLETRPVDPRDPLRGDYLVLSYKISDVPRAVFSPAVQGELPEGLDIYVVLVKRGVFHEVARASTAPLPAGDGEVLVRARAGWGDRNGWRGGQNGSSIHVCYGLERFYVAEGTGNPQGTLTVQAAVPKSGRASIKQVFLDGIPYRKAMSTPDASPARRAARVRTGAPNVITSAPPAVAVIRSNQMDELTGMQMTLADQRKQFGNDSTNAALTLADIAANLQAQGRFVEAEQSARESVAILRQRLGGEHLSVADALGVLSSALRDQGRLAEAEVVRRENLGIRRKTLGEDNPRVATSYEELGTILQRQGKLAEAETAIRRALDIHEKIYGPQSSQKRRTLAHLNEVLQLSGQPAR